MARGCIDIDELNPLPISINPKQVHRILKRREARARLEMLFSARRAETASSDSGQKKMGGVWPLMRPERTSDGRFVRVADGKLGRRGKGGEGWRGLDLMGLDLRGKMCVIP
jgi:hypothetical protein